MTWPLVFAYLRAWACARRIVAGRHIVGHTSYGAPIVHYTTPEAVEADFKSRQSAMAQNFGTPPLLDVHRAMRVAAIVARAYESKL